MTDYKDCKDCNYNIIIRSNKGHNVFFTFDVNLNKIMKSCPIVR